MHILLDNMGTLFFFSKIIFAFRVLDKINEQLSSLGKALFDVKVLLDIRNYLASFMSSCFVKSFV